MLATRGERTLLTGSSPDTRERRAMSDLPNTASPRLSAALQYWEKKRGGRLLPSRADIRLAEVPSLVGQLVIAELLPEPMDFRFDFVGAAVRHWLKTDISGKRMTEHPAMARVFENWVTAVRQARPHYVEAPYVARDGSVVSAQDMLMPLGDGDEVNAMMAVLEFAVPVKGLVSQPKRARNIA
jgi:hypothetical protein